MQRVCLKGFAGIFARDASEPARADEVNCHANAENDDGAQTGPDVRRMEDEAMDRFPDDVDRRDNQKRGLHERGKAFDFSVAVEMIGVGRLIRNANGQKSDHGGN